MFNVQTKMLGPNKSSLLAKTLQFTRVMLTDYSGQRERDLLVLFSISQVVLALLCPHSVNTGRSHLFARFLSTIAGKANVLWLTVKASLVVRTSTNGKPACAVQERTNSDNEVFSVLLKCSHV